MESYLSDLGIKPKEGGYFRYYPSIPVLDIFPGSHRLRQFLGICEKRSLSEAISLLNNVKETPNNYVINVSPYENVADIRHAMPC